MKLSAVWTLFQPKLGPRGHTTPPAQVMAASEAGLLTTVAVGQSCQVVAVHAPEGSPDWARWLNEIGFIPGESATVRARSPWGDGALVVRIGVSNFALRREEAACVSIKSI
ncbi:MAG: FeoA family protein [Burkholderiaceae bacterium]